MLKPEGPERMQLEFTLEPDDLRAFVRHTALEGSENHRWLLVSRFVLFAFVTLSSWASIVRAGVLPKTLPILAATVVSMGLCAALASWFIPLWVREAIWRRSAKRQIESTKGLGRWVFIADSQGLSHVHANGLGSVPWSAVERVDATASGVYIFTQPRNAHVIAASAFGSAAEAGNFARFCEEHVASSRRTSGSCIS